MKTLRTVTVLLSMTVGGLALANGQSLPSVDSLVAQLDRNQAGISSHVTGSLSVHDQWGDKVTGFEAWSRGSDDSLIVFTSGEDKGQKILRKGDTLYIAYPDADKPLKLSGAALKDSVAGSDFSYEDLAGDKTYASRYTGQIRGRATIHGEPCVELELRAKVTGVPYPLVRVWMSLNDFSVRKREEYSQNERLLKTQDVLEVLRSAGRTIPSLVVMTDALKASSSTRFELTKVELDRPVKSGLFSLEELTW